jgi:hypothetical protein
MMEEVTVETLVSHRNAHGATQRKEVGDRYVVPTRVAIRLMASDLVRVTDEPEKKSAPRKRRAAKKRG